MYSKPQHCGFGGFSENAEEGGHHPGPQTLGWGLKEAGRTKGREDDIRRGRPQVRPESRSEAWGYVERQVRQSRETLPLCIPQAPSPRFLFFLCLYPRCRSMGLFSSKKLLPSQRPFPCCWAGKQRISCVSEVCGKDWQEFCDIFPLGCSPCTL